ncbi:MAG TPA: ribosome maturation factor RimM [bacterium]|nr:ribosome maturation factor RimM [bacterium]
MARILIGKIRAAHGIRGELKVETYDRGSTSLKKGKPLFVDGEGAPRTITGVRPQRDWQLVTLERCESRNDAEALVGREVFLEREALPNLAAGEFYVSDAVGFAVVTKDGATIGTLEGSNEAAQTLLVVRGAPGTPQAGKEILVPCIEGIVLEIRAATRQVVIDPPEGLLEL